MTEATNKVCENISILIDEDQDESIPNEFDMSRLIFIDDADNEEDKLPQFLNYQLNFMVRQLNQICEYYTIPKPKKATKDEIIQLLVDFESDPSNYEIVCKRQLLWFYMNEIKNDKYMKKYILLW